MKLFFGIDGGATHSRIKILDENKNEVYFGEGRGTNINASGKEFVRKNMQALFEVVYRSGFSPSSFAGGCIGSSGLDSKPERDFFVQLVTQELGISCPVHYCNDAITALTGGVDGTEGYLLISGTGSIAVALRKDGASVRSGGWGQTLGDEGSGYWFGLQGLIRAVRSLENRDFPSALPRLMMEYYGINGVRELFPFVYGSFDKAKIASFAKVVFDAARAGDILADDILQRGASELVQLCTSVINRLKGIQTQELVFSGGILEHEAEFRSLITESLAIAAPDVKIIKRRRDPAYGACLLAMHTDKKQA